MFNNRIKELRSAAGEDTVRGTSEAPAEPTPITDPEQLLHLFQIHHFLQQRQRQEGAKKAVGPIADEGTSQQDGDIQLFLRNEGKLFTIIKERESDYKIYNTLADLLKLFQMTGREELVAFLEADKETDTHEQPSQQSDSILPNDPLRKKLGSILEILQQTKHAQEIIKEGKIAWNEQEGVTYGPIYGSLMPYFQKILKSNLSADTSNSTLLPTLSPDGASNIIQYLQSELARIRKDLGFTPFDPSKEDPTTADPSEKASREYKAQKTDAERADIARRLVAVYDDVDNIGEDDEGEGGRGESKQDKLAAVKQKLKGLVPDKLYQQLTNTEEEGGGEEEKQTEEEKIKGIIKIALISMLTSKAVELLTEEEKKEIGTIMENRKFSIYGLQLGSPNNVIDFLELSQQENDEDSTVDRDLLKYQKLLPYLCDSKQENITIPPDVFSIFSECQIENNQHLNNTKLLLQTFLQSKIEVHPVILLTLTSFIDYNYFFINDGDGGYHTISSLITIANKVKDGIRTQSGSIPQYYLDFIEMLEYYKNRDCSTITLADAQRYCDLKEQYRLWEQQADKGGKNVTEALNHAMTKLSLERGEESIQGALDKYLEDNGKIESLFSSATGEDGAAQESNPAAELARKYLTMPEGDTAYLNISPETKKYVQTEMAKTRLAAELLVNLIPMGNATGNKATAAALGLKRIEETEAKEGTAKPNAKMKISSAPGKVDKGIVFTPPKPEGENQQVKKLQEIAKGKEGEDSKEKIDTEKALGGAQVLSTTEGKAAQTGKQPQLYGEFLKNMDNMLTAAAVVHESRVREFTLIATKLYLLQRLQEKKEELGNKEKENAEDKTIKKELDEINKILEYEKGRYNEMLMEFAKTTCMTLELVRDSDGTREIVEIDGRETNVIHLPEEKLMENRKIIAKTFGDVVANFVAGEQAQKELAKAVSNDSLAKAIAEIEKAQVARDNDGPAPAVALEETHRRAGTEYRGEGYDTYSASGGGRAPAGLGMSPRGPASASSPEDYADQPGDSPSAPPKTLRQLYPYSPQGGWTGMDPSMVGAQSHSGFAGAGMTGSGPQPPLNPERLPPSSMGWQGTQLGGPSGTAAPWNARGPGEADPYGSKFSTLMVSGGSGVGGAGAPPPDSPPLSAYGASAARGARPAGGPDGSPHGAGYAGAAGTPRARVQALGGSGDPAAGKVVPPPTAPALLAASRENSGADGSGQSSSLSPRSSKGSGSSASSLSPQPPRGARPAPRSRHVSRSPRHGLPQPFPGSAPRHLTAGDSDSQQSIGGGM